ncbi:MAG: GNAT family N-acetyltransferase [Candidatus Marinimicrobia bacterium]|nr:GNAT family N-acetyltransferase [Candidatus Neomarinimicrobiota bacterium]
MMRLLGPDDKENLRRGFEELSVRTRRLRFLTLQDRLTESQLNYLTNMDNKNHLALGAFDTSHGEQKGIGVARYIRMSAEPETAEFAVTVLDAYQGRGVGRLLCELLIEAAQENAIKTFRGYIAQENASLVELLKQLGARSRMEESHLLRVDLDLPPVAAS